MYSFVFTYTYTFNKPNLLLLCIDFKDTRVYLCMFLFGGPFFLFQCGQRTFLKPLTYRFQAHLCNTKYIPFVHLALPRLASYIHKYKLDILSIIIVYRISSFFTKCFRCHLLSYSILNILFAISTDLSSTLKHSSFFFIACLILLT